MEVSPHRQKRYIVKGSFHVEFAVCVRAATPDAALEIVEDMSLTDFDHGPQCEMELNPETVEEVTEQ